MQRIRDPSGCLLSIALSRGLGSTFCECLDAFGERGFDTLEHFMEDITGMSDTAIRDIDTENCENYPRRLDSIPISSQLRNPNYRSDSLFSQLTSQSTPGKQEHVPFESFKVIVPSKSLNTTTLVSVAINGIVPKDPWIQAIQASDSSG